LQIAIRVAKAAPLSLRERVGVRGSQNDFGFEISDLRFQTWDFRSEILDLRF
jgi:hypothetical protein